jgi:hypothetical protein
MGKVDGTSAIVNNRGFIFLFNPNGRRLDADLPLDGSIGIVNPRAGESFVLKELYPVEGRLHGLFAAGEHVRLPMDGGSAAVFELQGAAPQPREPLLVNVTGDGRRPSCG